MTNRWGIRTLNICVLLISDSDHTGRSSQRGTEIRCIPSGRATSCGWYAVNTVPFCALFNLTGKPHLTANYIQSTFPNLHLYRVFNLPDSRSELSHHEFRVENISLCCHAFLKTGFSDEYLDRKSLYELHNLDCC